MLWDPDPFPVPTSMEDLAPAQTPHALHGRDCHQAQRDRRPHTTLKPNSGSSLRVTSHLPVQWSQRFIKRREPPSSWPWGPPLQRRPPSHLPPARPLALGTVARAAQPPPCTPPGAWNAAGDSAALPCSSPAGRLKPTVPANPSCVLLLVGSTFLPGEPTAHPAHARPAACSTRPASARPPLVPPRPRGPAPAPLCSGKPLLPGALLSLQLA